VGQINRLSDNKMGGARQLHESTWHKETHDKPCANKKQDYRRFQQ